MREVSQHAQDFLNDLFDRAGFALHADATEDDAGCTLKIEGTDAALLRSEGGELLDALLDQLAQVDRVTVARLGVNAEQAAAVHLYREAGFHVVGEGSVPP